MSEELTVREIDRIIEMAWEDRTPFEAIEFQFGLKENIWPVVMPLVARTPDSVTAQVC